MSQLDLKLLTHSPTRSVYSYLLNLLEHLIFWRCLLSPEFHYYLNSCNVIFQKEIHFFRIIPIAIIRKNAGSEDKINCHIHGKFTKKWECFSWNQTLSTGLYEIIIKILIIKNKNTISKVLMNDPQREMYAGVTRVVPLPRVRTPFL